ncbi:MAG: hypothetical protein NTX05_05460 [Fusobacteria bacterium]|nr:hypothetical protein [Fusobacteriota bacterium]
MFKRIDRNINLEKICIIIASLPLFSQTNVNDEYAMIVVKNCYNKLKEFSCSEDELFERITLQATKQLYLIYGIGHHNDTECIFNEMDSIIKAK